MLCMDTVVCTIRDFILIRTYILILIGALLSMWASSRVKSTFARYDRVRNIRGITGAQAAETILHQAGIYNVSIQRIQGSLTDHYDPAAKVLTTFRQCVWGHQCGGHWCGGP